MVIHGAKHHHKQAFLFLVVDIDNELFAMTASSARARTMAEAGLPEAERAAEVADLFCRDATGNVRKLFRDLWGNDNVAKYRVSPWACWRATRRGMEQLLEGLPAPASEKRARPVAA